MHVFFASAKAKTAWEVGLPERLNFGDYFWTNAKWASRLSKRPRHGRAGAAGGREGRPGQRDFSAKRRGPPKAGFGFPIGGFGFSIGGFENSIGGFENSKAGFERPKPATVCVALPAGRRDAAKGWRFYRRALTKRGLPKQSAWISAPRRPRLSKSAAVSGPRARLISTASVPPGAREPAAAASARAR